MTQQFQASYYNMRVPHDGAMLLYNGATGALLKLQPTLFEEVAPYLGPDRPRKAGAGYSEWSPPPFEKAAVPPRVAKLWEQFIDAGVFIPANRDEREKLKHEYTHGRTASPLLVTMTTTLNCNMRCYYCYQKDGELDHMSRETCGEAIRWTKDRIREKDDKRLYIDWYGGEPMLNQDVILQYSREMIPWCDERGVKYKAHMLCNGTNWPEDVKGFLEETRMTRIQFSVDGAERHHNKRRGLVGVDGKGPRAPSFEIVMSTIDKVIQHAIVYFRINLDPMSGDSCLELIDEFERRGWFRYEKRFYPYLAVINAMTEHCDFIAKSKRFEEFRPVYDRIRYDFYTRLSAFQGPDVLEHVEYYPRRKLINCAAVNPNSATFGPNGLMYKCALDVGDNFRAHDSLDGAKTLFKLTENKQDPERWEAYDPFSQSTCKECQYLPVCYGGCPRAQMDRTMHQIRDQNAYFENNFDRLITSYYERTDRI